MKGGYYRPVYLHTLKAGLDARGNVVGWQQRIVGQSILAGTPFEAMMVKDGIDATSVEGASTLPYAIPNLQRRPAFADGRRAGAVVALGRLDAHRVFDRDVHRRARARPPARIRSRSAARCSRSIRGISAALELAAEKAGWGTPLAPGKAGEKRGRGIAVHESFNTVVAQVAEVTVGKDNKFTVDRVVCAVDCGIAVNPDVVRAQMEGGIGFGLSAALYGAITLKDGAVEQSNFHDYPVLRINEMPAIEVHIVPSTDKPTGVGEPGVPSIAPAVANALAAATGQRLRNAAAEARLSRPMPDGDGSAAQAAGARAAGDAFRHGRSRRCRSPRSRAPRRFASCDALLPRLDADFGVGLGTAAQVVTAFAIAYGLLQAFYGPLGDHFGKYRVIAWACGASVCHARWAARSHPDSARCVIAALFRRRHRRGGDPAVDGVDRRRRPVRAPPAGARALPHRPDHRLRDRTACRRVCRRSSRLARAASSRWRSGSRCRARCCCAWTAGKRGFRSRQRASPLGAS